MYLLIYFDTLLLENILVY